MATAAVEAPKKRATANRTATITERLICPFDFRGIAERLGLSLTELGRRIGVPAANFHNWQNQMPGMAPLSVAKAAVVATGHQTPEEFEASVSGKVERRQKVVFVSDLTAKLARDYDRQRPGKRILTASGETLIIPEHVAPEPETAPDESIRGTITDDSAPEVADPEPPPPLPDVPPELVAASYIETPVSLPNHYEIVTPRGLVRVELPAQEMTPGERELYTSMLLRLNVQLSEVHRQNHELLILNRSLEAQASGLRGRIKELIDERAEIIERSRVAASKGVTAVQAVTVPKIATKDDAAKVAASVRAVPELERLVASIMRETTTVEAGNAAKGFMQGAAGAASLH